MKAIGTDDEQNLYNALKDEWQMSDHLSCFIHMKRNIQRKLSSLGVTGDGANSFIDEIFGKDG